MSAMEAAAESGARILFVPSARPGDGIGHLRRCIELAHSFPAGALLMPPARDQQERVMEVLAGIEPRLPQAKLCFDLSASSPWDLIVLDRRMTTPEEYLAFAPFAPVVGIDEGGAARELLPYLIDTLPLPPEMSKANVFSAAFLSRPSRRRSRGESTGRVLIAFGGEDPEGLAAKTATALVSEGLFASGEIAVARGPLARRSLLPAGVEVIDSPPDLKEELYRYDVVFTSFGLTAYEAVNAGACVILINPTPYHRRLTRIAGFPEAGLREPNTHLLRLLLSDRAALSERCRLIESESQRSIASHLLGLDFSCTAGCPACASLANPAIERMVDRSFFRCATCGLVYEQDFAPKRTSYGASYFVEEYREHYGKTYLEDFENIQRMGTGRLEKIGAHYGAFHGDRLLDVGCALGPFLAAATEAGLTAYGVDLSEEAVRYIRETMRLPAAQSSFESLDIAEAFGFDRVDILTMWYVIEHFPRLGEVLSKVNRLLRPGGVFAFSTPNLSGVSGYTDRARFLEASPRDHFTIWDPKTARAVLHRFGFKVVAVSITGHHPERFPVPGAQGGWRYRLLASYSRVIGLGDTFEVYGIKEREIPLPPGVRGSEGAEA